MMKPMRQRLLASTMIVGAASFSLGAAAHAQAVQTAQGQDLPPSPAFGPGAATTSTVTNADGAPTKVNEVVVTGSRIRSPSLTSPSPLTVVGSQEFTNIGATAVEQVLNQLPSVTADQTSGLSGLSNGIATINLRDLNAKRTLVLVNGKRLEPGDPTGLYTSAVPDVNTIPSELVDRVEVVTGGASAVYGSDAVAGVVNFVMKKNFQGVELEFTDNFAQHDNNDKVARGLISDAGFVEAPAGNQVYNIDEEASALFGVNAPDGKGNITGYLGYRHLEPIVEGKYDYSACTISAAASATAAANIYDTHACGGSSNGIYGKFVPTTGLSALGVDTSHQLHANPDGTQTFVTSHVPAYNYGATNYFQRSETRYTGGYFADYKVSPMFDVYSEFMFSDDSTVGQVAPSGFFAGTGPDGTSTYNINCNNPLLAASQQAQLCGTAAGSPTQVAYQIGYRFASFPREYGFEHTDYKLNIGSRGDLGAGWSYDAYLQYGTAIVSNLAQNDASTNRLQNALLVDPATGKCFSGGACVPINVFQLNGVTQAAFNYVSAPALQAGSTVEQVASGSISGDLGQYGIKSPFADTGVGVALGAEYRRENLTFRPDEEYISADLSGTSPALPNQGTFDVYELFGEIKVPLASNRPFVKDLSFDGGYRFSKYSTAGITDTYKAQMEYAPTPDIRFRVGYNRAVRAPNVVELFKPATIGGFGGSDPCTNTAKGKPTASLAACVASGLPQALYGNFLSDNFNCPAGQCSTLTGGNVNLQPEKSDTETAGFVLTPTMPWARGFTLSVDYFNIIVKNLIQAIPNDVFINECAAGQLNVCASRFHRDPTTFVIYGQTGYVSSLNTNSGFLRTDGIDVEADYRKRFTDFGLPDFGAVSISTYVTYTNSYTVQPVSGGAVYNCAGLYGLTCANPLPKIRGKARLTYIPPKLPVTVSAQLRYVGPVHLDANTSQPLLTNHAYGITDTADNSIHSFSYFDLTASWRIKDGLSLNVGCNNVLDKNPPVLDSGSFVGTGETAGNGNTFNGVYDYLGRTLFATIKADF